MTAWIGFAAVLACFSGSAAAEFARNWVYDGILAGAAAVCVARGVLVAHQRGVWLAMGAGLASWTGGELYYWLGAPPGGMLPTPSAADVGYLALYPFACLATVLLLRSQVARMRLSLCLDGVAAAFGVASVAAALVAGPIIAAAKSGELLATLVNLAYPIADVSLLAVAIAAIGLSGWRPGRAWVLLGTGLAVMAASDATYLYQSATDSYAGGWVDAGWPAAAVLVALAALSPAATPGEPRVSGRRTVAIPTATAVLAVGVLTLDHFATLTTAAVVLASATLLIVAVRMALSFLENQTMLEASLQDATHDALTGLGNRRLLMADLHEAVGRDLPPGQVRLLVLLDLNGFKRYNDSFGHAAGDSLLTRIGGRLDRVAGMGGRAYRLGGDEFCALVDVDASMAGVFERAAAGAMSEHGEGFRVTPSIGSVRLRTEAATPETALHLADRRMYAHKARGRTSATQQARDVLMSTLRESEPGLNEHVADVASLAMRVATELDLPAEELDEVARAAELHDVGKVAIPDEILNKPGPLDEDEWRFIRRHTLIGERILLSAPALRPVARLVRSSHERWDGAGYPDGLAGEEIPIGARIVAVCDAYEAMMSDRAYRPAIGHQAAVEELRDNAGSQFDAAVVDAMVRVTSAGEAGTGATRARSDA